MVRKVRQDRRAKEAMPTLYQLPTRTMKVLKRGKCHQKKASLCLLALLITLQIDPSIPKLTS